ALNPQSESDRRLALAQWIANPNNPLTARVMVNRLWQHHFGRGIVGTPSDFGRNGEKPTHPEVLDWLATDFMTNGWKMKRLHRMMVTSYVYRQTSGIGNSKRESKMQNAKCKMQNAKWGTAAKRRTPNAKRLNPSSVDSGNLLLW